MERHPQQQALACTPCRAGGHTPHLLAEALSWHERYAEQNSMRAG